MAIAIQLCSWISIVAGFVSAWLWYKASVTEVRKGDPRAMGGILIGNKEGKPQLDVYSTIVESSKANKQAAIATAVSVGAGAIGMLLGKL